MELQMSLDEFYRGFFPTIWLVWVITWCLFALNVKTTIRREATLPRLLNTALLLAACALLTVRHVRTPALMERFLPVSQWPFWAGLGAVLTLAGLLFTVWARVYLGRNWSGVVTIKADHELITTGPYGLVRHPIYSGLALAFVGSALGLGQWRGVLAVALALIAIAHRIIVEERFMREQFGAAYDVYAQRVRAFVPGVI
jgi:protein-S-isoprenylcysteine O-methyltransferase Ste14